MISKTQKSSLIDFLQSTGNTQYEENCLFEYTLRNGN